MSAITASPAKVPSSEWTANFTAYARAHGREPAAMLERDRERWPGGVMCGFILWVAARKLEFAGAFPCKMIGPDLIRDIPAWVAFLQEAGRNRVRLVDA